MMEPYMRPVIQWPHSPLWLFQSPDIDFYVLSFVRQKIVGDPLEAVTGQLKEMWGTCLHNYMVYGLWLSFSLVSIKPSQ